MSESHKTPARVRLAPSPTGHFHVGTARTALFNWLFAKQHNGSFIMRIEDTDAERSQRKYEVEILEALRWLGLDWDEGPTGEDQKYIGAHGPYRQSERKEIYRSYIEKLLAGGHAYYCYCTKEELEGERQALLSQGLPPKYNGHCRNLENSPAGKSPQTIRFKTPEAKVEFHDIIRGKVVFDASLLGDMVIAKDSTSPFFNFAVVIDDELMQITHIIRGEDHLSNTPKQILIQKALGFAEKTYAHIPLILSRDRSKLSKRHAETSLLEYRTSGFLPEAILNFLAFLGWHPKDDQEIFTREELVEKFDLSRVQKSGAIFDEEKLEWFQKEHMKRMSLDAMAQVLMPVLVRRGIATTNDFLKKVISVERRRLKHFGEFFELASFFFTMPEYDALLLAWQKEPLEKTKHTLEEILKKLEEAGGSAPSKDALMQKLAGIIEKAGRGAVLWPLRVAVSGKTSSPDPGEIIEVIGFDETRKRLRRAVEKIEEAALP